MQENQALNSICKLGFSHNKQSVRIVEKLEKKGAGLNLTWEVRDGILQSFRDTLTEIRIHWKEK